MSVHHASGQAPVATSASILLPCIQILKTQAVCTAQLYFVRAARKERDKPPTRVEFETTRLLSGSSANHGLPDFRIAGSPDLQSDVGVIMLNMVFRNY